MVKSIFGFTVGSNKTGQETPSSTAVDADSQPSIEGDDNEVIHTDQIAGSGTATEERPATLGAGIEFKDLKPRLPAPHKYGQISPSEVMAVVNQKGGCGKTTTAINLGASLAKKGQRVLLLDLDPQAHATLGLGIKPAEGVKTMYEVLMEQATPVAEAIHPTKVEKLHIVPGNSRLSSAQVDLLSWTDRERILKTKLLPCMSAYQCILIDCPPSLSMLTLNALVAADRIIVPIQTHYFALDGMKQLFSTVDQVRAHFNPALRVLGILTTMVDARTNICKDMIAAIRDYFKDEVFRVGIKMNVKLIECALYGESVITYAPQSSGALSYLELADEILERLSAPVHASAE